ncbi:hypothetical protein ACROYT_G023606 [Oculina patagonica]
MLREEGFRWADVARLLRVSPITLRRRRVEFEMPLGNNFDDIPNDVLDNLYQFFSARPPFVKSVYEIPWSSRSSCMVYSGKILNSVLSFDFKLSTKTSSIKRFSKISHFAAMSAPGLPAENKKSKPVKPMAWTTSHDQMLCREILVTDPFTGTRKSTVARGTKWEEVADNLNKIKEIYFKVDKRAVRDRYNLLSRELRKKLNREEKESGIETDMTEVEMALEELIEKEDAAETEQRVVDNQKKAKDSQDKENAENIRKKAMERLGQTQKRKADENESEGKRRKKRSSGSDTLSFLREKNEQSQELQKQELELKKQQLEVESKKQDNFMQVMLNQQQQQQKQMQDFQAMMSIQARQQSNLMLALVTKLVEKK